jgi:molybdopterin-binding protein
MILLWNRRAAGRTRSRRHELNHAEGSEVIAMITASDVILTVAD